MMNMRLNGNMAKKSKPAIARSAGILLAAVLTAGLCSAGCAKAEYAALGAAALLSLDGAEKAAGVADVAGVAVPADTAVLAGYGGASGSGSVAKSSEASSTVVLADAATARLADIGAPARYTAAFADAAGDIVVTADAAVTVPNASGMPVATVTRACFTQETSDKLIELFFGDSTLYGWDGHTDRRYMSQLKMRLTELRAMKNGEMPQYFDSGEKTPEELDAQIAELEALIELDRDMASFPADTGFSATGLAGEQAVRVQAAINGEPAYLSIVNSSPNAPGESAVFRHSRVSGYYFADGSALRDTQEEDAAAALQSADAFISELGLDDFAPVDIASGVLRDHGVFKDDYVRPVSEGGAGGYVVKPEDLQIEPDVPVVKLEYARQINGLPVTYTTVDNYNVSGLGDGAPPDGVDETPWLYERVTFYMEGGDIIGFDWASPYSEPEIATADARLLPFEDIAEIFEKMLPVTHAWVAEANAVNEIHNQYEVTVNNVKLGLMRVRAPGGIAAGDADADGAEDGAGAFAGVLVPVWDFIGDDRFGNYSGENTPILTVNALDGTIIDRARGR